MLVTHFKTNITHLQAGSAAHTIPLLKVGVQGPFGPLPGEQAQQLRFAKPHCTYFSFLPPDTLISPSYAPFYRGGRSGVQSYAQAAAPSQEPRRRLPQVLFSLLSGRCALASPVPRAHLRDLLAWVSLESFTPSLKAQLPGCCDEGRGKGGQCGSLGSEVDQPWRDGGPLTARGLIQQIRGSVPNHRNLPQGCTQPTHSSVLLAWAVPVQEVSLCQGSRKESRWHDQIPSKAEADWDSCVHVNMCVLVDPDSLLPRSRATWGLYTVPNLACGFSGNF